MFHHRAKVRVVHQENVGSNEGGRVLNDTLDHRFNVETNVFEGNLEAVVGRIDRFESSQEQFAFNGSTMIEVVPSPVPQTKHNGMQYHRLEFGVLFDGNETSYRRVNVLMKQGKSGVEQIPGSKEPIDDFPCDGKGPRSGETTGTASEQLKVAG